MTESSKAEFLNIIAEVMLPLFLVLFLLTIGLRAWMSDDAYITLRVVDNFINGYGLTWNISERVQPYTHPLWMLLLSIFYYFTREAYFSTIVISIVLTSIAVVLYSYKIIRVRSLAILGVVILILSRAFADYSTSGLENPLSHVLLVIFFIIYFGPETKINKPFLISLVASFSALNRLDTILIYIPSLVVLFWNNRSWKTFWFMLAGQIPVILWTLFSLIYYGFPFPNSAYAKLNTGIPLQDLIQQGFFYVINSIQVDPITMMFILLGIIAPFIMKEKQLFPLSIGNLLYLLYILRIGGDFMSGRFFTIPLLASLISLGILFSGRLNRLSKIIVFFLILALGLISPSPTFNIFEKGSMISDVGIADERGFYYPYTGILSVGLDSSTLDHPWAEEGRQNQTRIKPVIRQATGFYGYYAGPSVYIIDQNALSDPLLARLPINPDNYWRIGHFKRPIPGGYFETIMTGENVIEDQVINQFYDVIALITQGEIFDPQRLKAIWRINTRQIFG